MERARRACRLFDVRDANEQAPVRGSGHQGADEESHRRWGSVGSRHWAPSAAGTGAPSTAGTGPCCPRGAVSARTRRDEKQRRCRCPRAGKYNKLPPPTTAESSSLVDSMLQARRPALARHAVRRVRRRAPLRSVRRAVVDPAACCARQLVPEQRPGMDKVHTLCARHPLVAGPSSGSGGLLGTPLAWPCRTPLACRTPAVPSASPLIPRSSRAVGSERAVAQGTAERLPRGEQCRRVASSCRANGATGHSRRGR
jgi:hypothetical protein